MDVSKSLRMQSDTEKSACDHVGDQTLATQDCSHHIQAMVSFDPARMAWPGNPYNATTPTKVNGKCQESAPLGCQSIHSTSWRPNHRAKIGPFFCQSSQFVCHLFCLDKNLTNLANLHQELDVFSNFQELERFCPWKDLPNFEPVIHHHYSISCSTGAVRKWISVQNNQ